MTGQHTEEFVGEVCKGRDPSHGLEHMQKVRDNALLICRMMGVTDAQTISDVGLVALLHDVADHKYDKDGSLGLNEKIRMFLTEHSIDPAPVLSCINAISFSKEQRNGMRWFEKELDAYWVQVRDIVSDADKLEAIGLVGVRRCLEYAVSQGHRGSDVTKHLLTHMREKLLLIRDHYIVTDAGKLLAAPLHEEMMRCALDIAIDTFAYKSQDSSS
jgi:uncharacterized protein